MATAGQGRSEEGIAQMQEGLAASRSMAAELARPRDLCVLAEACVDAGRLDDGLSALTEALASTGGSEIRFYEAEAHRLKGELLLKQSHSCFERAIEIARRQSATIRLSVARSICRNCSMISP